MNVFYEIPDNIDSPSKIQEYYENRKYLILIHELLGVEDKKHKQFMKNVTLPEARSYYNVGDFEHEHEFNKNRSTGVAEYKVDPVSGYSAFWCYQGNKELLKKFDRRNHGTRYPSDQIETFLRKHQSGQTHDRIMLQQPKLESINENEAVSICNKELGVDIRKTFSVFNIFGIHCYGIYPNNKSDYMLGCFYYKQSNTPYTIPLGFKLSIVRSPLTNQLVHEMLHAVQYSYTTFYKYPKELVELPAMCLENKYVNYGTAFKDRTIALALADLKSDDPETFDKTFNKESKSTPEINISNRFWHYIHYPKQYYSYVFGMVIPYNQNNIRAWVRDPAECERYVKTLLSGSTACQTVKKPVDGYHDDFVYDACDCSETVKTITHPNRN